LHYLSVFYSSLAVCQFCVVCESDRKLSTVAVADTAEAGEVGVTVAVTEATNALPCSYLVFDLMMSLFNLVIA